MRTAAALFCLAVSGCGSLVPYRYAPSRLAPDMSPAPEGSSAVVTGRTRGPGGVDGRVLDRDTGAAVAGVRLTATAPDGRTADGTTDARGAFRIGLAGPATLSAAHACHARLDAPLAVGADTTATVLVLLMPANCD